MLLRNDLLCYAAPKARTVRLLWIDSERRHAYILELDSKNAQPEAISLASLEADVRSKRAQVLESDAYLIEADLAALPPRQLAVRDRAWAIVKALTADEPAIYQARERGRLVMAASAQHAVSHPSIYRYLRRFWERGQNPNALLPDYKNSGAPGKTRGSSAGIKRGRPRKDGSHQGVNTDDNVRRTFADAVASYAASHARFSRRGAYRQMIAEVYDASEPDAMPTFGQFNYWIEKDTPVTRRQNRVSGKARTQGQVQAQA